MLAHRDLTARFTRKLPMCVRVQPGTAAVLCGGRNKDSPPWGIALLWSLRYHHPMKDNRLNEKIAARVGCDSKTVSNVIRAHYPRLRQDPGRDDDIRREYRAGKTQVELADKYGLSRSQVWSICSA
jgi:hypothetical protein